MADSRQSRGRRERRSRRREQREQQEAQRRRRYIVFGGAISLALIAAIVLIVVNQPEDGGANLPQVQAAEADYDNIQSEAYFLGDPNAPVHLVEWADYQ